MKRIIAVIRPNMLDDVIYALHKIQDFPGATMTEVRGMGRSFSHRVKESRQTSPFGYPVQVRIEIICTEDRLEEIITTIENTARTGRSGDGKIFISPVENVVRVSSGQRGIEAIN